MHSSMFLLALTIMVVSMLPVWAVDSQTISSSNPVWLVPESMPGNYDPATDVINKHSFSTMGVELATAWQGVWQSCTHDRPQNVKYAPLTQPPFGQSSVVFSEHFNFDLFTQYRRCPGNMTNSGPKPRVVLVTLLHRQHTERLHQILPNWCTNVLNHTSYDLAVLFQLDRHLPGSLQSFTTLVKQEWKNTGCTSNVQVVAMPGTGYIHMNLQLGRDMYRHPQLRQYDYFFRLDSDLMFLSPIQYDPVEFMVHNGLRVGYSCLGMPEICPQTVSNGQPWENRVRAFFVSQGFLPLGKLEVDSNYGHHDTILAGPVEIVHRTVFDNEFYYRFWEYTGLEDYHSDRPYSYIREQYFKSVWIQFTVAPMQVFWFCDFHTSHKIEFKPRCTVKCAGSS